MQKTIDYHDGDQRLEGYLSVPASPTGLAGVVIAPTWLNVSEGIRKRADRFAALGHPAFVMDVLGAGVRPMPPQDPRDVIMPFMKDRRLYRRRLLAGLNAFLQLDLCEPHNVVAVGYCFGGAGVLELARSGAAIQGVVSLHGELRTPLPAEPGAIKPRIVVLHGDADPLIPFEHVTAFQREMRRAKANWQLTIYGNAKHAFTGEGLVGGNTPEAGLDPQADARSWQSTIAFLREFGGSTAAGGSDERRMTK